MKILLTTVTLILSLATVQAQDSFENALRAHVRELTADRLNGRQAGTRGDSLAAAYISRLFNEKGLELLYPRGYQDFSFVDESTGDTLFSRNVVAVIPGYDPVLRDEYIVIGAHYDHLGKYIMRVNGKDSLCIYPGADANASGVAALLELAGAAQEQFFMYRRSLLFVAFGAGEMGALGSWYFVNRAFPSSAVKMMINLDRVGKASLDNPPKVFCGQPHYELEQLLTYLTYNSFVPQVQVYGSDYFPSDHQAFMEQGIPVCLFTTGLHPHHQTLRDTPDKLDYERMDDFCQFISLFIMEAANDAGDLFRREKTTQPQVAGDHVYAYSEVDLPPTFMNGDIQSFVDRWLYKYQKYPREAVSQGLSGRVMVSFVIEKNGEVTQVEVTRSVHPLLDQEAVRVITASPKWKAGEKKGEKVRVKITLPVYFKLAPIR
ncbi:MAG: TonB family protein [Bacteroidales bacterium]|jgi:TonB family protein|nr:TonB family protein [Bacteroidales bacterium]MDD2264410.1 TonB family protein [Bacteroidales bacterium]MDD2831644.1 TonB family protein [Bacteroidales bacterium]MDD3209209.1 TonB family protein [Bacteroidales bacterium]MDD3697506.1 TonB family protein [Bacteroidales bacterium]